MTKKIVSTGVVIGTIFMFVGCGGGSSATNAGATNPNSVATGTAHYVDSAVSGVNYKCGTQEGITGADGSFTFEVGSSCTFYLGDMKLREVDAGLLVDGESVYETDVNIARILQSLDSDGNPDNGITIEAATVQALANEGITSLPKTETEMDEMLAVIAANGGTEVSEEGAEAHMLTTLLGGKTFYITVCDSYRDENGNTVANNHVETLVFGTNGKLTDTWIEGGEQKKVIMDYSIDGDVLSVITPDGETITFRNPEQTATTITFANAYSEEGGRFFFDYATAEATLGSCSE